MKQVFLSFILLMSTTLSIAQNRQADSLALVNFYTTNCNTGCTLNWDLNQSMDNWDGVLIRNERVYSLSAVNKGLTGALLDLNLTALKYLYLSANDLSGSIPDFNNSPLLEILFVALNQLSGSIPDFSAMPNLKYIKFSNNNLTDSIPNFTNLPLLERLGVDGNQLSGSIPDFSAIPNLKYMEFSNNNLTDSIPNFTNLPLLEQLGVDGNQLSGGIPDFSAIPNLRDMGLSNNNLTGSIPNFTNLPKLYSVSLSNNKLSGTIPPFNNQIDGFRLSISRNAFTFEDFLPNYNAVSSATGNNWDYNNQDSIGVATSVGVALGSNYTIDLVVDSGVNNSTYTWYKNGIQVAILNTNKYTIYNFQSSDIAIYHASVINSTVSQMYSTDQNLRLNSRPVFLDIGTSINQVSTKKLEVFPNPTQDILYINAAMLSGEFEVELINLEGKKIKQLTGTGNTLFLFPLNELPKGVYIIRLQQGDNIWQEKVVKQ